MISIIVDDDRSLLSHFSYDFGDCTVIFLNENNWQNTWFSIQTKKRVPSQQYYNYYVLVEFI